ncbi:MAG TPA: hypothetical protein VIV66_20850, partial [Pyrinomonadaceae bacterium]
MNSQLAEDNRREHQTNPSQPGACIKAISGSVTNALDPFTEPEVDDCKSSFRTLQTADREALNLLIAGLRTSNGYCPGDVAILSEEGTEYGNLTEFKDGGSEPSVSEPCGARDKALYLHFPREISKLRNASIAVLTAQGAKDNASAAKTDVLPLNWQDAHPFVKDDVRNYGEQTAVSEETVLASLATLIRSQRIKTMGIFATDPLDTAFLIHSFRQSTPDVRLFIRDPDLLYLRTPDVGSLNGILAINNFPLIPQNQVWTQPADDGRHHVVMFPSSAQEAEYSAFITLARQKLRREPLPEPYLLDAGWPKAAPADNPKSQPLWIGVTGTAGYYPIRFLNQDASTHDRAFLHSLDVGRPPYACILAMLVIGFIGLLHATWAAFPGTAASWFKTDFDISDRFDALSVAKGLCHAIALLSLCLCVSLIASSFLFFHSTGYRVIVGQYRISVYRLGAAFGIIVVLVLLLAAAWRLCDSVIIPALTRNASFLHNDVLSARKTALTIPFALAVFVAPIVLWIVNTSAATFDNAFMHYRDLYLGSGVAPALPALLLAVIAYIGVLTYLRRVSDWEYGSVRTPPMQLDELFSGDFTA